MKRLSFQIQNKKRTYTIYNLQHLIYLATQIELQIETQYQKNLDDVIKRLDEIKDLIKQWHVSMKVPKIIPMSLLIVEEKDSYEILEEKTGIEDEDIIDLYEIFKEEVQPTLDLNIEPNNVIEFAKQNQVAETPTMINIIMPIHVEDNKVILEEGLDTKIKFIGENIEQDLVKNLRGLGLICLYRTSPFAT